MPLIFCYLFLLLSPFLDTFSLRVYPSVRAVCPHYHCGKTAEKRGGKHSECMPILNERFYLPARACFSWMNYCSCKYQTVSDIWNFIHNKSNFSLCLDDCLGIISFQTVTLRKKITYAEYLTLFYLLLCPYNKLFCLCNINLSRT